ncbi:Phosphoenolpyruvate/pyruvate domain-containing protein [Cadophora sp. DSE1049]|nr:Phosphoenolpyruvate/pyruvate domain-containing protein [Cadophora sp. DSE1049]
MSNAPLTGAKRLRELLADRHKIVVCPGVYDGITARLSRAAGFEALYMTGAGTSMSKLGWADLGMATLNDMQSNASMIASLDPSCPVIADADTGYGGPVMVARTVAQYSRGGVAALHIEDQVQEKRCGHLLGKQIVDREMFYTRLRAAVKARNDLQSDMLIIARTDARQSFGFDEAAERLKEAVKIGVDAVFLEALQSKDEARRICETMGDVPVLLNMVPGGTTPDITVDEAKNLGFRIITFPGLSLTPVMLGVQAELEHLKTNGFVSPENAGHGVKGLFNMCGLQECIDIDKAAGGKAYADVGK